MRLGKGFGNGQAETESAITPLKRALALFERIKNAIHDFRFDSDSGVVHRDGEKLRLRIGRRNCDLAVVGGELDRVLEQVPDNLLVLGGVARDVMGAAAQIKMQFQIPRLRFRATDLYDVVDDFVGIERAESQ